ncbi:MAG TPA: nitronate monooxygenase, partial [Acetobacteraceae bacterium]
MPVPPALSGLRLPVIAAPMFIVSGVELVLAQCRAGIVGSFPALNARPQDAFHDWLCRIEDGVGGRPYAVNLICHASNDRLGGDVETCARHKVPLLLTSLQAPRDAA